MFRASGAMEWLSGLCAPLLGKVGIPADLTPLMLIRPISGSGALAVGSEVMKTYGPDSYTGRVAAVMASASKSGRNRRIEKDILSEIQLGMKQYISLFDKIKHKRVTNLHFHQFTTAFLTESRMRQLFNSPKKYKKYLYHT